ncbi:MAG: dUTP diphosphatase [bacterium]
MEKLKIKKLPHANDLPLPCYMSRSASGLDLFAAVEIETIINPMERVLIPTGIAIELPEGFEAQVRPRSGLALKHGITLLNTPGTIDEDYRGEIKLIVINLSKEPFTVRRGDRIAQLVVAKRYQVLVEEVKDISSTERSDGGFGHTGI